MDDDESQGCPFCGSSGRCAHLLLHVDKTFRSAEDGVMMHAFNNRWSGMCEAGGDDFDEGEPFDELLCEIDCLADASVDSDHECGPGMSSAYVTYYVESPSKAQDALVRFSGGGA